jgi:GntR family transcriptional repressor for pyruvate dehydrogenase complex
VPNRSDVQDGQPGSLTDHLERSVLRLIHQDHLTSGDRLPSIKAMAERFAVATPTMREAIRRLEVMGVVEIQHGSGVYVRNTSARVVFGHPGNSFADERSALELLEARLAIEPLMAARAAARISRKQSAELRDLIEAAADKLDQDAELHDLNMKFHCMLAELSGNRIMHQTLLSYTEIYSVEQIHILKLHGREKRAIDHGEHRSIAEAVIARRSKEAHDLMAQHLQSVIRKVTGQEATWFET